MGLNSFQFFLRSFVHSFCSLCIFSFLPFDYVSLIALFRTVHWHTHSHTTDWALHNVPNTTFAWSWPKRKLVSKKKIEQKKYNVDYQHVNSLQIKMERMQTTGIRVPRHTNGTFCRMNWTEKRSYVVPFQWWPQRIIKEHFSKSAARFIDCVRVCFRFGQSFSDRNRRQNFKIKVFKSQSDAIVGINLVNLMKCSPSMVNFIFICDAVAKIGAEKLTTFGTKRSFSDRNDYPFLRSAAKTWIMNLWLETVVRLNIMCRNAWAIPCLSIGGHLFHFIQRVYIVPLATTQVNGSMCYIAFHLHSIIPDASPGSSICRPTMANASESQGSPAILLLWWWRMIPWRCCGGIGSLPKKNTDLEWYSLSLEAVQQPKHTDTCKKMELSGLWNGTHVHTTCHQPIFTELWATHIHIIKHSFSPTLSNVHTHTHRRTAHKNNRPKSISEFRTTSKKAKKGNRKMIEEEWIRVHNEIK